MKNEGSEPHQALVIRLPEGVSEYGEERLVRARQQRPRAWTSASAVSTQLAPGGGRIVHAPISSLGQLSAALRDAEDEGRHYELGMIYRFTIEIAEPGGVTART